MSCALYSLSLSCVPVCAREQAQADALSLLCTVCTCSLASPLLSLSAVSLFFLYSFLRCPPCACGCLGRAVSWPARRASLPFYSWLCSIVLSSSPCPCPGSQVSGSSWSLAQVVSDGLPIFFTLMPDLAITLPTILPLLLAQASPCTCSSLPVSCYTNPCPLLPLPALACGLVHCTL